MKAVIQRVTEAKVVVGGKTVGVIGGGLLILLGISKADTAADADYLLDKLVHLRIFNDAEGKMNRDVQQVNGSLLIVSQFTLYADCRKGRRPNFDQAAPRTQAESLYSYFVEAARKYPVPIQTGIFQATMEVHLINEGPVTIVIDSKDRPLHD
jgi:D-tyrosyl-tRNA(Tyr) deacylase